MESPEINPYVDGPMFFFKVSKATLFLSLFNVWHWENQISTWKRMELNPYLTLYRKINSKWIKDLNERPKMIKKNTRRKHRKSFMALDLAMISISVHSLYKLVTK